MEDESSSSKLEDETETKYSSRIVSYDEEKDDDVRKVRKRFSETAITSHVEDNEIIVENSTLLNGGEPLETLD